MNTTGLHNTASGYRALAANTTGYQNTACGTFALSANTTGTGNTANGYIALSINTTGYHNTASGYWALPFNTTGSGNTASGSKALYSNTTGDANVACGQYALRYNTTGNLNTASGFQALYSNTTGSANIALGVGAGSLLTTGDSNIVIGNPGVADEAATIRIGTPGTHTRVFIAGIDGTNVSGAAVLVDTSGQLGINTSSRRFKTDIADMGDATERLLELRPVVFHYRQEQRLPDGSEVPMEYGLIAEEVAEIFPDLVVYDEEGNPFTVKYHLLSAMLLNELKKLGETHAREVNELRNAQGEQRSEFEARIAALESRISTATVATSCSR
jgi:hypothetical protein